MSAYKEYMNRITVDEAQHEALMTALREASAPVTDVLNEDRSLKRKKKPGFVLLIRRASLAAAAVLLMLLLPGLLPADRVRSSNNKCFEAEPVCEPESCLTYAAYSEGRSNLKDNETAYSVCETGELLECAPAWPCEAFVLEEKTETAQLLRKLLLEITNHAETDGQRTAADVAAEKCLRFSLDGCSWMYSGSESAVLCRERPEGPVYILGAETAASLSRLLEQTGCTRENTGGEKP